MRRASSHDLLLISKALKDKLEAFAAGAFLVQRTGYNIPQLRAKAALDRFTFARYILRTADTISAMTPPMNRMVVCRSYYAMYHAFRAVTYFVHGGDDHEKHSDLPSKLPRDFPNRAVWENKLKNARLERNRADYDPYPRDESGFGTIAVDLLADAKSLMPVVKQYLQTKGCVL